MKKCFSFLALFFLGLTVLSLSALAGIPPAKANLYHGIMMQDGKDSIYLQSTQLDFYIDSLDETDIHHNHLEMLYSFKNIGSTPCVATFYLPVENASTNLEQLQIMAKEEALQPQLRYSYTSEYQDFAQNLNSLKDTYQEEGFYKRNLPVHHYTFKLIGLSPDQRLEVLYKYSFSFNETKLFTNSLSSYSMSENIVGVYAAPELDFYFVGDDVVDPLSSMKVCALGTDSEIKEVKIALSKKEELTFEEFAFLNYKEHPGLTHVDYYNAVVDKLLEDTYSYDRVRDIQTIQLDFLQSWVQYELNFGANETIENKISLPISGFRGADDFAFTFSFAFLQFFKNPGKINLRIFTDFYLWNRDFTKTEYGYVQSDIEYEEFSYFTFKLQAEEGGDIAWLENYITYAFLYLLYILPIVGLCIFFFVDKKRFVRGTAYVSLFLIYSMGYASFVSLLYPYFFYVSYSLLIGSVIFLLIELFVLKKNSLIQLLGTFGLWILATIFLCLRELEVAGVICFLFGCILTIYSLVHLIGRGNVTPDSRKDKNFKKERFIAVGYTSMREFVVTVIFMLIVLFIACLISGLLSQIIPPYACFFISIGVILLGFLGIILGKARKDSKEFRQFFKDLDIEKLEKALELKLSHPKIHPETRNYYYLLFSSYALVYRKELYEAYEEKIFVPQNKVYRRIYDFSRLHILLSKDEYDRIEEKLRKNYYNKKAYLKKLDQFCERAKPMYHKQNTVSIDLLYRQETKNAFQKAIDLFLLIQVYRNQGDEEKAQSLENEFRKSYSQMEVLIERLDQREVVAEKKEL